MANYRTPILFLGAGSRSNQAALRGAYEFRAFLRKNASCLRLVSSEFYCSEKAVVENPSNESEYAYNQIGQIFEDAIRELVIPVFFGAEHVVTYYILRAIASFVPQLTLVVFDAHSDVQGSESELRSWNVMRLLLSELDTRIKLVNIGFRDLDFADLQNYADCIVTSEQVNQDTIQNVVSWIRNHVGMCPIYLSVDVDVLDPLIFPSVSAPISGGLTPAQIFSIIQGFSDLRIVGADIVGYHPREPNTNEMLMLADLFGLIQRLCWHE